MQQYQNKFVAQMKRKDSPIKPEEVIPALLTEDPETIRVVMSVIGNSEEAQDLLRREARKLIEVVEAGGETIPKAEEKLEALGINRTA